MKAWVFLDILVAVTPNLAPENSGPEDVANGPNRLSFLSNATFKVDSNTLES